MVVFLKASKHEVHTIAFNFFLFFHIDQFDIYFVIIKSKKKCETFLLKKSVGFNGFAKNISADRSGVNL